MNSLSPLLLNSTPASLFRAFSAGQNPAADSPAIQSSKVVIVYDDLPAGERAVRELTRLKATSHPEAKLWPIPWSFDYLVDLSWRTRALNDVDAADVLILSISHLEEMPAAIGHWIKTCLGRNRVQSIPVLALFDGDFTWTLSLQGAMAAVPSRPAPAPAAAPSRKIHPFPFTSLSHPLAHACA